MASTGRPYAESCDYNKFPIADVFKSLLSPKPPVRVLELGSGTGQHAAYFTEVFPQISLWLPTDVETEHAGIRQWTEACPSVRPPRALVFEDCAEAWEAVRSEGGAFDIVFTANTFHIAPWDAVLVCMERLPLVVKPGGAFVVYGPFNYNGTFTTPSNERFDAWLKTHRSPKSGIRHAEEVTARLEAQGFALETDHEMPDNNRCLVFRRAEK